MFLISLFLQYLSVTVLGELIIIAKPKCKKKKKDLFLESVPYFVPDSINSPFI